MKTDRGEESVRLGRFIRVREMEGRGEGGTVVGYDVGLRTRGGKRGERRWIAQALKALRTLGERGMGGTETGPV